MNRKSWTILVVLSLTLAVSGLLIFAGSGSRDLQDRDERETNVRPQPAEKFLQCPTPACMAPCALNGPATVLCESPDGSVAATTWGCCCCGSSGGVNQYRPL